MHINSQEEFISVASQVTYTLHR